MKLRDHYDWMVLGDHPGALLSAGLAARLGLSVLILPVFPSQGLVVSKDGYFVDPESNYQLGLGRVPRFPGLLGECLGRLGILPAELEQIQGQHPLPQVLTPELRMDFGGEDDSLAAEWMRELGKERANRVGLVGALRRSESELLSYWLQLPERLTLTPGKKRPQGSPLNLNEVRRRLAKELADPVQGRWFAAGSRASALARGLREPDLQPLLAGLWASLAQSECEDPSLAALLPLLAVGRTGAAFRGGMTAYRDFLMRLAKRLGAHFPPKTEVRRVFVEKGRFTGVQIANRGSMIGGGGAIVGCSLSQLSELVSMGGRAWFKRLKASPKAAGWKFTLAFTVRSEGIPPGSSGRMVWVEPEAPALEIEVVSPADYGARKPGRQVILARAMMPQTAESLTPEFQRMVGARMMRQLSEIFPFVENHVEEIYPEFRAGAPAARAGELEETYRFKSLDEIPENLRVLSRSARGLGSRSGIEGLFVASGESFPELGSLGGSVAALESVSWLAHRAGLAGPFA